MQLSSSSITTPVSFAVRSVCELCGAATGVVLRDLPWTAPAVWPFLDHYYAGRIVPQQLTSGRYTIVQCRSCGFLWQREILDDAGMALLYDSWISAEVSRAKKLNAPLSLYTAYTRTIKTIAALFPQRPRATVRILDFGMGWGIWCLLAQAHGYTVVGHELSQERLAFAQQRGVAVATSLDELVPQSFDFINAEQVFEHVPQPVAVLRHLVEMLAPGGVVRLAVPNGQGIEQVLAQPAWRASKDALHPLEHINCFTPQTLRLLGQMAGLRPLYLPLRLLPLDHKLPARLLVAGLERLTSSATVAYFIRSPTTGA